MKIPASRRRPQTRQQAPQQRRTVEPITEALALLQRQATIQDALRHRRGSYIVEERELYLIRRQLTQFPAAVETIALTAAELRRPVDTLSVRDVERCG